MGIDSNSSIWITGYDVKVDTHKLRSRVDGILIGRKTAEIDNPKLTVREVNGKNPIRIVADDQESIPDNFTTVSYTHLTLPTKA